MKKYSTLLLLPFLVILAVNVKGQATAMDFQLDDCEGPSHHLFTELDAGKVTILEFVMLNCAPCILGTNALKGITDEYEVSHPGRVHIYSFGFLNSYTCEQIVAWKNDNSFTHSVFNNGEDQVAYYGGMGMPTIVVVGTNQHKVFYKSIGYTPAIDDDIRRALDSALIYNPTGIGDETALSGPRIYPTLVTDHFYVDPGTMQGEADILLYDSFGREVLNSTMHASQKTSIPVTGLSKGIYFARIRQNNKLSGSARLIVQ
jgi:hypothetical protein